MNLYRIALLLSLFLAAPAWSAGVYRWTDADGNVHFGDEPPAQRKAETVELKYNEVGSTPVPPGTFDKRPQVIMYSAAWCGVCAKAKAFLKSRSVSFAEYDIETSRKGRDDYRRLQGTGVPIIMVGDERMNGFSAPRLTAMLEQAGHLRTTP